MKNPNTDINELLGDIHRYFKESLPPKNSEILRFGSHAWDDIYPFLDPLWKNWKEVPCHLLHDNYDALAFFSPTAFYFYIPAFIMCSLTNVKSNLIEFTSIALSDCLHSTDNSGNLPSINSSESNLSYFNSKQLYILQQYLHIAKRYL